LYEELAEYVTDISEDLLKNQALFTQALVFIPCQENEKMRKKDTP